MKIKLISVMTAIVAVLMAMAMLSSCGTVIIKTPDSETTVSGTTTASGTAATPFIKAPICQMPDLSKLDITKYITLGSLENLKAEVKVGVTDEDVDEMMQSVAEQNKFYTAYITDRATAAGDILVIDFVGTLDGVAFEGGTAANATISLTETTGYIPGFDKDLYGIMPGVTVRTEVTFPENYGNETLNGKKTVFEITVKGIVSEYGFTDEYVKQFTYSTSTQTSDFSTVAELHAYYKKALLDNNVKYYESNCTEAKFKAVADVSTFASIPSELTNHYYYIYANEYNYYGAMYGLTSYEEYLTMYGISAADLMSFAESSAKQDLIAYAAEAAFLIELTDAEYSEGAEALVTEYGFDNREALVEAYGEPFVRAYVLRAECEKYLDGIIELTSDYEQYKPADTTAEAVTTADPSDTSAAS